MLHFLHALLQPLAVLLLFVWLYAFWVHLIGGYAGLREPTTRNTASVLAFICFLVLCVVGFLAWAVLVFTS